MGRGWRSAIWMVVLVFAIKLAAGTTTTENTATTTGTKLSLSNVPCVAFDLAERYDFTFIQGLTFNFYDSTLDQTFVMAVCDHMETMIGNFEGLDILNDRYSTNVQGTMSEFLVDRTYEEPKYQYADIATWAFGNVVKFRQKMTGGSQGPPCNMELDRTAGATEHAPQYGGREASVNIHCGGCPDWDPSTYTGTTALYTGDELTVEQQNSNLLAMSDQMCTRFVVGDKNYGQPADVDLITAETIAVPDPSACVCSVERVSACNIAVNITTTCPTPGKAFNEIKRLKSLAVFVGFITLVFCIFACMRFRTKQQKTGKSFKILEKMGAGSAMSRVNLNPLSKIKLGSTVPGWQDAIPAPPQNTDN